MKNCVLLFLIVLLADAEAQDVNFLATNQSLVSANPSFAGSNGAWRNQFSYASSRTSLYTRSASTNNTFDMYVKSVKAGLAVTAQGDDYRNGTIRTLGVGMAYAQYIELPGGKNKLIPSVQVFARHLSTDYTALTSDQFKPAFRSSLYHSNETRNYLDINAGLLYSNNDRLFIGASVFHLNSPDPGIKMIYDIGLRYSFYTSYNFILGEKSVLQVMYKWDRQNITTSQLGANVNLLKHLVLGGGYYSGRVLYANAGLKSEGLTLCFAYHSATSMFRENKGGSWEFHLSFNLKKETKEVPASFEKMY